MNNDVLFSSKTDNWATPPEVFKDLDNEFKFTLDPCASKENHKCDKYFTKEENGLLQDWGGQRVYCNPPYGRTVGDWVEKAAKESRKENTTVVMLLPARTDTKWFHKFGVSKNSAPFPPMIVIF